MTIEFKVGDRVKILENDLGAQVGHIGLIIGIDGNTILVEDSDGNIGFWSCRSQHLEKLLPEGIQMPDVKELLDMDAKNEPLDQCEKCGFLKEQCGCKNDPFGLYNLSSNHENLRDKFALKFIDIFYDYSIKGSEEISWGKVVRRSYQMADFAMKVREEK